MLVRSKSFSLALEAEGRRYLRGMPKVKSLRACVKAYKAARAWALPGVPGGGGLKGGLRALCNAIQNAACCVLVGRVSGVTHLKNTPYLEVNSTPICSTIPLGSLHNQHLEPAPPIACIPFPSPVKITMQVKYWF